MLCGRHPLPDLHAGARRQLARGSVYRYGFPKVFYLKYHNYRLYFPLMALARYQRLMGGTAAREFHVNGVARKAGNSTAPTYAWQDT